jgi:hypothetical protein
MRDAGQDKTKKQSKQARERLPEQALASTQTVRERAIVDVFETLLYHYLYHPESKSLGPSGKPCRHDTFGLLQRAHIIAGEHQPLGKEVDRLWEEVNDLDAMRRRPIEYERRTRRASEPTVRPSLYLSLLVKEIGIRKLMRQGFGRRIGEKISRRVLVNASTYHEYERRIEEYARTTRRRKGATKPEHHHLRTDRDTHHRHPNYGFWRVSLAALPTLRRTPTVVGPCRFWPFHEIQPFSLNSVRFAFPRVCGCRRR